MTYTLRLTGLSDDKDDFEFCVDGIACGRTYLDIRPHGPKWTWSIYGIRLRGPLPADVSLQGAEDTRQLAGEAFKRNWEKLVATGNARLT